MHKQHLLFLTLCDKEKLTGEKELERKGNIWRERGLLKEKSPPSPSLSHLQDLDTKWAGGSPRRVSRPLCIKSSCEDLIRGFIATRSVRWLHTTNSPSKRFLTVRNEKGLDYQSYDQRMVPSLHMMCARRIAARIRFFMTGPPFLSSLNYICRKKSKNL